MSKSFKFFFCSLALLATPAFAAGGSGSSVDTLFNTILTTLQGLSLVVVTIAIMWAGYKMLFKGASIMDIGGPVLAAIAIGAAPWLAELLVG